MRVNLLYSISTVATFAVSSASAACSQQPTPLKGPAEVMAEAEKSNFPGLAVGVVKGKTVKSHWTAAR